MELYSIIKNDGPAGAIFWKFTGEDFRIGSQLIVAENEEALLVRDGVIQEVFSGGRHTLQTNNFPLIDKLLSKFSGGKNAFSKELLAEEDNVVLRLRFRLRGSVRVGDVLELALEDAVFAASDESLSLAMTTGTLKTQNGRLVIGE